MAKYLKYFPKRFRLPYRQTIFTATQMFQLARRRMQGIVAMPLLVVMSMSSCKTVPAQLWSQADCRYTEIRLDDWKRSLASSGGTLRVLLVHGMNNHPFGIEGDNPRLAGQYTYYGLRKELKRWDQQSSAWQKDRVNEALANGWSELVDKMAGRFGHSNSSSDSQSLSFELIRDPRTGTALGYVLTREFPANGDRPAIKFYIANWALSVATIKEEQFGSWGLLKNEDVPTGTYVEGRVSEMDPTLNKYRAPANKNLKLHTVNWGLGDPSLYLTKAGPSVRRVVSNALRQMAADAGPSDRAAIIAASLGSTVALDCAAAFLEKTQPEGLDDWQWGEKALRSRTLLFTKPDSEQNCPTARAAIYLFANQWALLTMGRASSSQASPDASLMKLDRALAHTPNAVVQIYGFTDPNDLLSYPLNPKLKHASVCNIYVRNPSMTLGFLVHPGDAHVNYEKNPKVVDAMFSGPRDVILPRHCDVSAP